MVKLKTLGTRCRPWSGSDPSVPITCPRVVAEARHQALQGAEIPAGDCTIDAKQVLLARFKGRAVKLCVRLGMALSAQAVLLGALASAAPTRRVAAAFVVLVGWVAADRSRRSWIPDVLTDRRYILGLAAASLGPFAIDGHAQSDVFMAMAPLAGVAAAACRRREVVAFAAIWTLAYLGGVALGGGGIDALVTGEHPFDAVQQSFLIAACCGLLAVAVVGFRRFVAAIPAGLVEAPDDPMQAARMPTGGAPEERECENDLSAAVVAPNHVIGIERPTLSARESEVLDLLAAGNTRQQIAGQLCISPHTVRSHIDSARQKYGVHTQAEAVAGFVRERAADV